MVNVIVEGTVCILRPAGEPLCSLVVLGCYSLTITIRKVSRFFRMWGYYLLSCAGTFRASINQLWQVVFSKDGLKGGYQAENIR